jgi:hypothetical protein
MHAELRVARPAFSPERPAALYRSTGDPVAACVVEPVIAARVFAAPDEERLGRGQA